MTQIKISKTHVVDHLASTTGVSKKAARDAVDIVLQFILENAQNGNTVDLHGFGSFYPHVRLARDARNPRTGEAIQIPEKTYLKFRAKPAVNKTL